MSTRWALFGEVLGTGVLVLVASIPVITLPAALAAGVAHLRRHGHGLPTTVRGFASDWWRAVRVTVVPALALLALAALVSVNLDIAGTGALAGAGLVRIVSLAVLVTAVTIMLRAAGCWSSTEGRDNGLGAVALGRAAWERTRHDPSGSVLALAGTAASAALARLVVPLLVVVGGLACMAIVAVDIRHEGADGP